MNNIFIILISTFTSIAILLIIYRCKIRKRLKEDNKILEEIKKHMKTLKEIQSKRGKEYE